MAQHQPGAGGDYADPNYRPPSVQDLDVTVLAFAQWLSEMKGRSNSSLTQMLAEMGIIRNGITSNNTDLAEFKRNTATVQQQMQSQISDLRDKLREAYIEIASLKKGKSQFEQEVHAQYQSMADQVQFKTLETETLKKAYAHTHQQLQQQIVQLQTEVNELRLRGDDAHRQTHLTYEQSANKLSEIEMTSQYSVTEMKRLRGDHDQAIANLAENMNKWNDTVRDLSKEFHDFQKVMNVNQQRVQSSIWDVQGKFAGIQGTQGGPRTSVDGAGARMESAREPVMGGGVGVGAGVSVVTGGAGRNPPVRQQVVPGGCPPGVPQSMSSAALRPQPQAIETTNAAAAALANAHNPWMPNAQGQPYIMR